MQSDKGLFCDFCGRVMNTVYRAIDLPRGIEVPSGNPKGLLVVIGAYGDVARTDVCQTCYENAVCQAYSKIKARDN